MIEITQNVTPESLYDTETRAAWRARCVIDGRTYEAVSRNGAVHALARVLVAARIPDQPARIITMSPFVPSRVIEDYTHPNIHAMAKETP